MDQQGSESASQGSPGTNDADGATHKVLIEMNVLGFAKLISISGDGQDDHAFSTL